MTASRSSCADALSVRLSVCLSVCLCLRVGVHHWRHIGGVGAATDEMTVSVSVFTPPAARAGAGHDQDECEGVEVVIDAAAFPLPADGQPGVQQLKVGLQSNLELVKHVWYWKCIVLCRDEGERRGGRARRAVLTRPQICRCRCRRSKSLVCMYRPSWTAWSARSQRPARPMSRRCRLLRVSSCLRNSSQRRRPSTTTLRLPTCCAHRRTLSGPQSATSLVRAVAPCCV